jgi:hypothetical protein
MVPSAWRHAGVVPFDKGVWLARGSLSGKTISEIPCRVNCDPHEKRNDWATVSAGLSVKL